MIVDERLVTYINSLDTGNTAMLDQIEREATADYVPIIRKEMQSFLKFLLAMKKPARILEVGTAVGFSAILSTFIFCRRFCVFWRGTVCWCRTMCCRTAT